MKGKFAKRRGVTTKTMMMVLALVLVIGCTIGGTIAWLTAQSEKVTNTFSVGKIGITLTETTETYKIVPGGESAKDPKITVEKGSEKCYVYAYVVNNLLIDGDTVATPDIDTTKWEVVESDGTGTLYRYKSVVDAADAAQELQIFTKVTYAGSLTKANLETLDGKTITIQGYAHQSDNTDQATADAAAQAWVDTLS